MNCLLADDFHFDRQAGLWCPTERVLGKNYLKTLFNIVEDPLKKIVEFLCVV